MIVKDKVLNHITETYDTVTFGGIPFDICNEPHTKDTKTIVLISGKAGSGKNEFAKHLKEYLEVIGNYKVIEDMFAKSLKDLAARCTVKLRELLLEVAYSVSNMAEGDNMEDFIATELSRILFSQYDFYERKTPLTRILLEMIGTDIIREINPNWHIEKLIERTRQQEFDFKLVTDTRFENEIALTENTLSEYRVISIRINRDNVENNTHISNTALDYFHGFDYVLENNGTIDDLKLLAQQIAEQIEV